MLLQVSASSGLIGQFGSYNDTVLSDVLAYGNNGCTHHYTFDERDGSRAGNWEDGDELLNSADTAASGETLSCAGDDATMVSGSVLADAVIGTAIGGALSFVGDLLNSLGVVGKILKICMILILKLG